MEGSGRDLHTQTQAHSTSAWNSRRAQLENGGEDVAWLSKREELGLGLARDARHDTHDKSSKVFARGAL